MTIDIQNTHLRLPAFIAKSTDKDIWLAQLYTALQQYARFLEVAIANAGGSADLTDYFKLSGRAGGQVGNGGEASGENLTLHSNPTDDGKVIIDDPSRFQVNRNGLGITRLLLGGTTDPGDSIVPGGAFQVCLVSDLGSDPLGSIFGLWTINGGPSQPGTFMGVGSNGSRSAPTASMNLDNLAGLFGNGFDSNDVFAFNPPAGSMIVAVDGSPMPGLIPGQLVFSTTSPNGTDVAQLWLRGVLGRVAVGNFFNVPIAKLHVRSGSFLGQGTEFDNQMTLAISANEGQTQDLEQWLQEINLTMAMTANPGDLSIFLSDTSQLPTAGNVFVVYDGAINSALQYEALAFTANNTGTGELTLAAPLTGTITNGVLVYFLILLSKVDILGAWHPPTIADGDAQDNSMYFSSTSNKLVYKDSGGTPHDLY